jgi:hypothetical protein
LANIIYSSSLIQSFEKSLNSAFNRPVQLTKKTDKHIGEFTVAPVDGDTYAHTNEGTERPVCEIRNAENKKTGFYFTFAAKFRQSMRSEYALRHSSLQVFQDIGDYIPLFRADWDQDATLDGTSEHAQPHWHFVQRPSRIEEIVRKVMSPPSEFVPYEQSELFTEYADCGKFHFAMSPLWEKNKPNAYKRDYEPSDFPLWFDNLTKYVAAQIAYIIMKAPPMPTKEFVPEEPSAGRIQDAGN